MADESRAPEFSGEPLSPEENRRVRKLLRDDDRAHWFWASVRTWASYIGVAAVTVAAVKTLGGDLKSAVLTWLGGLK